MSEPFIGEVKIFGFGFPPKGWMLCSGQLLPINQYQALFSILGTMYGGNGISTFGLPNLQGRIALNIGNEFVQGGYGGEQNHTLTVTEIPSHTHTASASSNIPDSNTPANSFWASNTGFNPYSASANETMAADALLPAGTSQPHSNMGPYLVVNFCIAITGIYPSRN